ncbi:hypothetical protein B0H16DRAFT_1459772 [Mycena metata]|uniref:Uncharacterized protein n=1 Tax=Mycena metata TaxID=1033252 RepID=A0AAD7IYS1_9AGAR|nr:hypothetical protein B0H16DRAFT_1459772 [Mycena metata]
MMFNKYALFFFASIATSAVAAPLVARACDTAGLASNLADLQSNAATVVARTADPDALITRDPTFETVVIPAIDAAVKAVGANDIAAALTNIVTITSNLQPVLAGIDFQDGQDSPADSNILIALNKLNALVPACP